RSRRRWRRRCRRSRRAPRAAPSPTSTPCTAAAPPTCARPSRMRSAASSGSTAPHAGTSSWSRRSPASGAVDSSGCSTRRARRWARAACGNGSSTRWSSRRRAGRDAEVDELRESARDGKGWLARFETAERARTGIASLKVRYNRVFGYYVEVTRANLALVPQDYERKQTLVGAERFVTPALKEHEARVLGAEERLRVLETHLFETLLDTV